ncbi:MAG: hypothetical protein V9G16_06330 [Nitrosomonas sp.]
MPLETFRWFAMLRYEFVVLLMMTSFLLVKGLRIAMMYQGVWSCPNLTDIFSWSRVSLDL